ncbi:uncharacterized protein LOC109609219 [Aethina tumida]|uniref:uncharacterized protein LOC109609219 n=1 Tax=Aethina tumida TaxID=116153 RepID=UPI0021474F84|nr:uncharacterized protein LOC109609219 [Aethina tumida]
MITASLGQDIHFENLKNLLDSWSQKVNQWKKILKIRSQELYSVQAASNSDFKLNTINVYKFQHHLLIADIEYLLDVYTKIEESITNIDEEITGNTGRRVCLELYRKKAHDTLNKINRASGETLSLNVVSDNLLSYISLLEMILQRTILIKKSLSAIEKVWL